MKLPRFPIRKSLIPYDDLGIQEVSGDNQVLGDDIGITLAPAIGMGPTGARVLQTDKDGNLRINIAKQNTYASSGKHIVLGDFHVTDIDFFIEPIDLSLYNAVILLCSITNDTNADTVTTLQYSLLDSNNIYYNVANLGSFSDNGLIQAFLSPLYNGIILTNNARIVSQFIGAGKSFDIHIEYYGY